MTRTIFMALTLLASSLAEGSGPADTLRAIFATCEQYGYSSEECSSNIAGSNRGIFRVRVAHEVLESTEREYQEFLDSYPTTNGMYVDFAMLRFEMDVDTKVAMKLDQVTDDLFVTHGDFLVLIEDENVSSGMGLVEIDGKWRLAFSDQFEKEFRESGKAYDIYLLLATRINILKFNIAKAKKDDLSRNEIINAVNAASAPLLLAIRPDRADELRKWLKHDLQETIDFYMDGAAMKSELAK